MHLTISSGLLRQSLQTKFALSTVKVQARPTAGATKDLQVSARALPPNVVPPAPVYIVVYALNHGAVQAGAGVRVKVTFKEGVVTLTGVTDANGVATIKVDTSKARESESVNVSASVTWHSSSSTSTTLFDTNLTSGHASPVPTARPADTISPGVVQAATPSPTMAPPPSPTATIGVTLSPFATPTPYPTSTPFPTPTAYPTTTPYPTATPYPTPTVYVAPTASSTNTPVPTVTPVPTATSLPTATVTPLPTGTSTPTPACPGSQSGCMQAMLNILNTTRASYGLYPLILNVTQSNGTSNCVGSYGHSEAMAQSGEIWHTNSAYPAASFPSNICVSTSSAAENVGQFSSSSELTDLQSMNNLMMSEPHDASTCATQVNHACDILTTAFHQVGIGIYNASGRTWLTEDFVQ